MVAATSEQMLAMLDRGRLDARYWRLFTLLALGFALDFFDFFVVGYIVAAVGPTWHLTYGQSASMLLGGGIGAILGALTWGGLTDKWGRKKLLVLGSFVCAAGAGGLSLVHDGDWVTFTILRFFVGVGLAGCATAMTTLIVEYTPVRYRTVVTSLQIVFATGGSFLAALTAAHLLGTIGWRGIAAIGVVPAIMGVVYMFAIPESARWLAAKGRFREARATVAWILQVPDETIPLPSVTPAVQPQARMSELLHYPRLFWLCYLTWLGTATAIYGVLLWGPTVVALLLKVPASEAAGYFVYVTLAGITGKVVISFMAQWLGRRVCCQIAGFGAAVALALAAFSYIPIVVVGLPVFVWALIIAELFLEGQAAVITPWAVEAYGVRLGARAAGLSQTGNGCGKIVGPMCLALIAGTSNFVSPHATAEAVVPAFLFLAAASAMVALTGLFLGPETHGKPLSIEADTRSIRSSKTQAASARALAR